MKVSELLAMLPRRAQKMSSLEAIYYLNYPIKEDIQGLVQALFPSYYEKTAIYRVEFPTTDILSFSSLGTATKCTVASNILSDGDVVIITDSSAGYNGRYVIKNTTVTSFVIDTPFISNDTAVAESDFVSELPVDCVYPTKVEARNYGRIKIKAISKYENSPDSVRIDDNKIVVPVGAPYRNVQIWYFHEIPLIVDVESDIPYPSRAHRQLVPILLYGMCLEFFRDRKKANDIQIYLDKYNQARENVARLSVTSLC